MKTTSLDMLLSGKRENCLITDRIIRVLHYVRVHAGLASSLHRVFLFIYFFYEINNTIYIQIYLYPYPADFQTRPNFKTVQAMTTKISDLTSYCKQADLFVFVLSPLHEFWPYFADKCMVNR